MDKYQEITCPDCGGNILGDGQTVVRHCENVDITDGSYEADSLVVYCGGKENPRPQVTLRLLEWRNAPFMFINEQVRKGIDGMGT